MNIFVLDNDPHKAAVMHCDKHVVKMILESAQMLCTAHHLHPSGSYPIAYKKAHVNHPCTKWVRESLSNYKWLVSLAKNLNDEYKFRYNHTVNHKSFDVINSLPMPDIPDLGLTQFVTAMPDDCKTLDPVLSYRTYYNYHKRKILIYTKRSKPVWIVTNAVEK